MDKTSIGIDVSKLKFDVAVWIDRKKYKTKAFSNDTTGFNQFITWLSAYEHCHICLEATGSYSNALAIFLVDNGFNVSVENPSSIHAFGKSELNRNKTDEGDAKMIARYCALHSPRLWFPAPLNERQLSALMRRLNNLEKMKQMECNRQKVADEIVQPSLAENITALEKQLIEIKQKIKKYIDDAPELKKNKQWLESIPGIGEILSATLLAFVGDISKFSSSKQVVAYTGLNLKLCESGLLKGRSRLSKVGCAKLRKALYMPALTSITHNSVIKAQWERLVKRNKGGKIGI